MDIQPAYAPSLPTLYAGGQQFSQALAIYNNSKLFTDPSLVEPPIQDLNEMRMNTLDTTMSSVKTSAGDLFSSVVRANFMKAFGIGHQTMNANKAHNPLVDRIMSGGTDALKDMGSYLYSGKSFGKEMSATTKAMKWFAPVQIRRNPSKMFGARLGRSMTSGFRSFLGWNYILGNPDNMTAGDMTMSYMKNVAVSYGLDLAATKFLRRPGAIINHLSTMFKEDAVEKLFGENGLIGKNVQSGFSDQLKKKIQQYSAGGVTGSQKAELARRIRRNAGKELDRLSIKNPALYENAWGNARNLFNEAADVTEKIAKDAYSKLPKGLRKTLEISPRPKDILQGVSLRSATKEVFRDSYRFVTGQASKETVAASVGAMSSRLMRNTWTLGGISLRIANIASGGLAAASIANEVIKYRDNVRTEYIRNMTSDKMAYTMAPEFGMSGTERTRAVEAIQNSSMNLRNFLSQEAGMIH